jgi:hypothetical protein
MPDGLKVFKKKSQTQDTTALAGENPGWEGSLVDGFTPGMRRHAQATWPANTELGETTR